MRLKSELSARIGRTVIARRLLALLLFLTAVAIVAGHIINRLTSPRPLNPLWNRISTFAASEYGGGYVTAGINLFAVSLLLFGVLMIVRTREAVLFTLGGLCFVLSSVPMALMAHLPIFTPYESAAPAVVSPLHTAAEILSFHRHNLSSGFAFSLLLAGIFFISLPFLRASDTRALGGFGFIVCPLAIFFLVLSHVSHFYNGSWQRAALILAYVWVAFAVRRMPDGG